MGLAPYGEPRYRDLILTHLLDLKEDGSFKLNLDYFNYCQGLTMTNQKFADLFGGPPRPPESPLTQREMDLAASIQKVAEEVVLALARQVHRETGEKNLVLAGGVALNCVANGLLLNQKPDQATLDFTERVTDNFGDWGGAFSPRAWIKLEALLEEMSRLAKRHKFQLVIIAFPVSFQVEAPRLFDYPQQRLSQIAKTLNVPCLDLLPVFRKDYEKNKKGGDRLFYDQCHLTGRGHQVAAQAIYRFLRQTSPGGK